MHPHAAYSRGMHSVSSMSIEVELDGAQLMQVIMHIDSDHKRSHWQKFSFKMLVHPAQPGPFEFRPGPLITLESTGSACGQPGPSSALVDTKVTHVLYSNSFAAKSICKLLFQHRSVSQTWMILA